MQQFWTGWSHILLRHTTLVIAVTLTAIAFFSYKAATTPLDLSFTGMINQNHPEVAGYRNALDTFGASTLLILLIEGDEDEVWQAVDALTEELPNRAHLKRVIPPLEPQWAIDRGPWLWPEPLFQSVVAEATSGADSEATARTLEGVNTFIRNTARPLREAAIVQIEMVSEPLDMAIGGEEFRAIERETMALLEEKGLDVTAGFTGIAAVGAQDQNNVLSRIKILTPITMVLVLLILFWAEPSPRSVLLAGVALGGAVGIAFGLLGMLRGELTIGATFFGMALLGLGIDFGIHLLVALRDGRAHGHEAGPSLEDAVSRTGNAIALGAISTALAFGLVALVPEPGARDMGLVAVFGLVAALVLMLSFLPASWYYFERRHHGKEAPPRMNLPGLRPVVTFALRFPKTVIAIAVVVTALGAIKAPQYEAETDLEKIITRDTPAMRVQERLQELFGVTPMVFIAPMDSLEEARRATEAFKKLDEVGSVLSPSDFIHENIAEREAAMRAAIDEAPDSRAKTLLATALEAGAPSLDTLPDALTIGTVGKGGAVAVRIVPNDYNLDAYAIGDKLERFREIAPSTTGMPVMAKLAIMGQRDYVPYMIPSILAVVTLTLIVAFRSIRDVALGLIPVIVGTCVSFGAFVWLDIQFSVLTSVVVPVILGLGVDDGIHVVERLRHHKARHPDDIHDAIEGVGRPIFLTTATTVVSFIGLLFTDHAGLESVAWFMLMGVPVCFIASITVLPAAALLTAGKD